MEQINSNVITLAETLKSLALPTKEEGLAAAASSPRKRRLAYWLIGLLAGVALAAFAVWDRLPTALGFREAALRWTIQAGTPGADGAADIAADGAASTPSQPPPQTPAAAEITGSGYVTAPRTIAVYAERTDRIVAVYVSAGQTVKGEQPLAEMEGTSQHFALERARMTEAASALDVRAKTINLAQARSNNERMQKVAQKGAGTLANADDARIALQKAEVDLGRARQQLAQSELDLRVAQDAVDRLVIRAPFDGTVTDLSARVGITVFEAGSLDAGESHLVTIVDTVDLVIDADFAERNLAAFQHPITAEAVLDAFPDQPFAIKLERIEPVVSVQKGTFGVRFRIINPPVGIRPNMAVRIRVTKADPAIASRSNIP